ncbi:FecR family protein [Myxococcota bacterium]|nr:FecR family protein [Myxococcota bacterium]MBU1381024.1 FecR family protein [Myxococcota bacterium]MBU1499075.1 FecR family protein [Myxococcota bacterium]
MKTDNGKLIEKAKELHISTRAPVNDKVMIALMRQRCEGKKKTWLLHPAFAASFGIIILIAIAGFWFMSKPSGEVKNFENISFAQEVPVVIASDKNDIQPEKNNIQPQTPFLLASDNTEVELTGSGKLAVGVDAISDGKSILKMDGNKIRLISGDVTFTVAPRNTSNKLIVVAGDMEVTVIGTIFRVVNKTGETRVWLKKGSVSVSQGKISKVLKPSEVWPEMPFNLTLTQVAARLADLRTKGAHKESALLLRKAIAKYGKSPAGQSLYIDLASIYGVHLRKWDSACSILKRYKTNFPSGTHHLAADMLWNRFRCN